MEKDNKYFGWLALSMICFVSIHMTSSLVSAESIDSLHLLKTSPSDSRAVVKMKDGTMMKLIKPGDAIGKNGKVIEITTNRVVIEGQTERGMETVIIRLENGKQNIERISRAPDRQPHLFKVQ